MKKIVWIFYCSIFFNLYAFAQLKKGQIDPTKAPGRYQHYLPEYIFDVPSNPLQWASQKPGLNVSFASTDELYLRVEIPQLQKVTQLWEATGWRGERLNTQILLWSPVPCEHRFRYLDESAGNYIYEQWSPDSEKFKSFWKIFLDALKLHLEKKGWFEKTYLGINENPLDVTIAAIKVIKNHSPSWKLTYAGDWHPELSALLDDYSPIISSEPNAKELKERKIKKFTTTYYVCCTPSKPNNFVFSPPIEGWFIGWYAEAYGYDGFLRWAYDAWPADPIRDARHTLWPAGDCFLIYPGGNSSIRFEKLREGIIDFEKIKILRELASTSTDKKVKDGIKELENHLRLFIDDPDYSKRDVSTEKIKTLVLRGEKMIEALSDKF